MPASIVSLGPFGIDALRPQNLFGLVDLPPLAQGTAVRVQVLRVDLLEATLEARYAGPVERAMAGTEAAA